MEMNLVVAPLLPLIVITLDLVQVLSLSDDVDGHNNDLGSHIVDHTISASREIDVLGSRGCKDCCCREKKRGEKRQKFHLLIIRLLRYERRYKRKMPPLFIVWGA